jgi:hypothetical protein
MHSHIDENAKDVTDGMYIVLGFIVGFGAGVVATTAVVVIAIVLINSF